MEKADDPFDLPEASESNSEVLALIRAAECQASMARREFSDRELVERSPCAPIEEGARMRKEG